MQQIIMTWRQDDAYADQIIERILNSVELKNLLKADQTIELA